MKNYILPIIAATEAVTTATVTMPTISAINFNDIMKTIASSIAVLILAVAIIYGGWQLYEGFSDNSSATKKQGFFIILGGIVAAGLMYALLTSIFSVSW